MLPSIQRHKVTDDELEQTKIIIALLMHTLHTKWGLSYGLMIRRVESVDFIKKGVNQITHKAQLYSFL